MDFTLLIVIIILAFAFDFVNGFHDAANSIATIVSTKVLTPFQAVVWAASFNFLAYAIFELHIVDTISKTVDTGVINLQVILAGLVAATIWNLLTWYLGIPSSSSHTLVGGFAGAAVAFGGWGIVHTGVILKIGAFIFLAPLLGMVISYFFSILLLYITKRAKPAKVHKVFRPLQLVSSALFSLGHGGNDAQKVMGIIAAALFAGYTQNGIDMGIRTIGEMPDWVAFSCFTVISLGTMSGGWKIVKTMGSRITKVTPLEGVAAETAGALTLYLTEILRIPVSTTHTITGAIIGVGSVKRLSAVRWGVTKSLLVAWFLTIPVSAALAALIYLIFGTMLY